jgi:hypothetical protein
MKKDCAISACTMKNSSSLLDEAITKAIDDAIRQHELRVALWSGLLGTILLAGTWHAIAMLR